MGLRRDGRQPGELREVRIIYEGLARVDGSARFSHGDITSLASVSGPIEVRLAAEQASQATFEVLIRPLTNVPATEAKSFSSAIRAALLPSLILTKHPRTLIQLVVQSLNLTRAEWKDTLMASMINASTLALLNASSVPMRGVACAVAVGQLPDIGFVVDPSDEECIGMRAGGCFAFIFAEGIGSGVESVWTSWRSQSGYFSEQAFAEAHELARTAAQGVRNAMQASVPWMGTAEPFEFTSSAMLKLPGGKSRENEEDDAKMEI